MRKETELFHLFRRFAEDNYTAKDLRQLKETINDPAENETVKKAVKQLWYAQISSKTKTRDFDLEANLDKIHHKINRLHGRTIDTHRKNSARRIVSQTIHIYYKAAAVLLLPLLSVAIMYFYNVQFEDTRKSTNKTLYSEITAPMGSRIKMGLPDGSQVWLNHGSKLRYPQNFGEKSREVDLTGEAYFNVKENPENPFIVNTSKLDVHVTGTKFNIAAYANESTIGISLEKGSVQLYKEQSGNKQPRELYKLKPGEHAAYYPDSNKLDIIRGKNDIYTAWKYGKIIFRNEPLHLIAKRLERRYNVDIVLKDKKLKAYTFTATFLDETLNQVLNLLSKAVPLEYTIESMEQNEDNTFTKRKVFIELKGKKNN